IASTPVRAAAPDENARRRTSTPTAPRPVFVGSGTCAVGHEPAAQRPIPVAIRTYIATTNEYVGSAKRTPDSRTPRRFTTVSRTTKPSDSTTLWLASDGAVEVIASTPAATETATVRT